MGDAGHGQAVFLRVAEAAAVAGQPRRDERRAVIGKDGALGDMMSTTLFAMGREKAMSWASQKGIDCVLCDDNGTLWISSSLKGKIDAENGWKIKYFD